MRSSIFQGSTLVSESKSATNHRKSYNRGNDPRRTQSQSKKNGEFTSFSSIPKANRRLDTNSPKLKNVAWNLSEMLNAYREEHLLPPKLTPTLPPLEEGTEETAKKHDSESKKSTTEDIKNLSILSPTLPAAFEGNESSGKLHQPTPTLIKSQMANNLVKNISKSKHDKNNVNVTFSCQKVVDSSPIFSVNMHFKDLAKYKSAIRHGETRKEEIEGLGITYSNDKVKDTRDNSKIPSQYGNLQDFDNETANEVCLNKNDQHPVQIDKIDERIEKDQPEEAALKSYNSSSMKLGNWIKLSRKLKKCAEREKDSIVKTLQLCDSLILRINSYIEHEENIENDDKMERRWSLILNDCSDLVNSFVDLVNNEFHTDKTSLPGKLKLKDASNLFVGILHDLKAILFNKINHLTKKSLKEKRSTGILNPNELLDLVSSQKSIINNYEAAFQNFSIAQSYFDQSSSIELLFPGAWAKRCHRMENMDTKSYYLPVGVYTDINQINRLLYECLNELSLYLKKEKSPTVEKWKLYSEISFQ